MLRVIFMDKFAPINSSVMDRLFGLFLPRVPDAREWKPSFCMTIAEQTAVVAKGQRRTAMGAGSDIEVGRRDWGIHRSWKRGKDFPIFSILVFFVSELGRGKFKGNPTNYCNFSHPDDISLLLLFLLYFAYNFSSCICLKGLELVWLNWICSFHSFGIWLIWQDKYQNFRQICLYL